MIFVRLAIGISSLGLRAYRVCPVSRSTRIAASARISGGSIPGGTRRNKESLDRVVTYNDAIDEIDRLLLCDAQTSGGLLFAVEPSRFEDLLSGLAEAGVSAAAIGEFIAEPEGKIEVVS